jgi:hypothetical protein
MASPNSNNADVFQPSGSGGEAFPGLSGKIGNQNADVFQGGETLWLLQPLAVPTVQTLYGVVSLTETVTVTTTVAARTLYGSTSLTETVAVATAGTRTTHGSTSTTLTVSTSTSGARVTYGQAATTLTVTVSTAGARVAYGATSTALTVTVTTGGVTGLTGSATLDLTVTITTSATASYFESVTVPVNVSVTTSGHVYGLILPPFVLPPAPDGSFVLTPDEPDEFELAAAGVGEFVLIPLPDREG